MKLDEPGPRGYSIREIGGALFIFNGDQHEARAGIARGDLYLESVLDALVFDLNGIPQEWEPDERLLTDERFSGWTREQLATVIRRHRFSLYLQLVWPPASLASGPL